MMMKQLTGQHRQQHVQILKNKQNDNDDDDEEACQVVDEDELRDSSIHEGFFNALPSFRRVHASLASHNKAAGAISSNSSNTNQLISQDHTSNAQAVPLKGGKGINAKQSGLSKAVSSSLSYSASHLISSSNTGSPPPQLYQFLFSDWMLSKILPFLNISEVLTVYQLFIPCEFSLADMGIHKVVASKHMPKTQQLPKQAATPIIAVSSASTAQTSVDSEYCFLQQSKDNNSQQFFHVRFSPSKRILAAALTARLCSSTEAITIKESQAFFSATIRLGTIAKLFPSDLVLKMQMPSGYEQDIQRDAERTFLDKIKPSERHSCMEQLITVLRGLSQSIKEIGYIQGWNNIAGSLIRMEFPQELAYWTLNYFLKKMQLKQLYIDDFKTAHFLDYALEVFCKNYLPELFRFMKDMDLELCYFSTSWFLTLFSVELSPEAQAKVLMLIALKGWKYLIKIALAVLIITKDSILSCSDEEEINQVLKKSASKHLLQNEQQLFRTAQKVKVTNTLLSRLQHLHSASGIQQNVQIKRIKIASNSFKTIIELQQQQQSQYYNPKSGLNSSASGSQRQQQYQQSSSEIFCKDENEEDSSSSTNNDFQITYYLKSSQDNNNITMRSQQLSMNNNSYIELISESGAALPPQTKQQSIQQISLSSRESNIQDDVTSSRNGKINQNTNSNTTQETNKQSKKSILDGLVMFLENRWTHKDDHLSRNVSATQDATQSSSHLLSVPRNHQPIIRQTATSVSKAHNATAGMRRHTEMGVHSDVSEQTFFHKKLLQLTQDKQVDKSHSSGSSSRSNDTSNEDNKDNTTSKEKQKEMFAKKKNKSTAPPVSLLKQSKSTIVSSSPKKKNEEQEEDCISTEKPEDSSFLQKIIRIFKPKDSNSAPGSKLKRLSYSNNTLDQDTISSGCTQVACQQELICSNQQKTMVANSRLQRNKSHDIGVFQQASGQAQLQQEFPQGEDANNPISKTMSHEDKSNELNKQSTTPLPLLTHSRQQSHTPSQSSSQSALGYYSIQATTNRKSTRLPNSKKVFAGMQQQQSQQQLPSWNHSERIHTNNPQPFSVSVNHQQGKQQAAQVPSQNEQLRQAYNTASTITNNNNNNYLSSKPSDNSHELNGSQQPSQKQQQSEEQEQSFSIARKSSYLPTKHPYFQQLASNYEQQPSTSSLEPPFTPLCYQSIPTNQSSSEIQMNHHQNSTDGWENYNSTVVSEHSPMEATHTPPFFLHSNQRKKNEMKKITMPQQLSLNNNIIGIAPVNAVVESYGLGMTTGTAITAAIKPANNINNPKINNALFSINHDQQQQQLPQQQLLSDWRNTLKKPSDNSQVCNSSTEFSLNESQQLRSVLSKQQMKGTTTTQPESGTNITSSNNNSNNNQNQTQGIGYLQGFKHSTSDIVLPSQKKPNNRYAEHIVKGQQITHL